MVRTPAINRRLPAIQLETPAIQAKSPAILHNRQSTFTPNSQIVHSSVAGEQQ